MLCNFLTPLMPVLNEMVASQSKLSRVQINSSTSYEGYIESCKIVNLRVYHLQCEWEPNMIYSIYNT